MATEVHLVKMLHSAERGEGYSGLQGRGEFLVFQAMARLPVTDQNGDGHPARGPQVSHVHPLLRPSPLHFVPVVLEPDFDLGRSEAQQAGKVLPLRGRQVALLPETPLKFVGLRLGEEHSALPPLAHLAAIPRGLFVIILRLIRRQLRGFEVLLCVLRQGIHC